MKKKSSSGPSAIASYTEPKRVSVEKAGNGFVVDHHGPHGRKTMVAKSHNEMMKHVKKLLGK